MIELTDRLMTKNWKKKLDLIYVFVFIITFFSLKKKIDRNRLPNYRCDKIENVRIRCNWIGVAFLDGFETTFDGNITFNSEMSSGSSRRTE